MSAPIHIIGIFGNRAADERVRARMDELDAQLKERGARTVGGDPGAAARAGMDLAMVVGGDGSILHTARAIADEGGGGAPLLGVNVGRLGFLTDIAAEHMGRDLDLLLTGKYELETRMLLAVTTASGYAADAVNDIVIGKGRLGHLIEFDIRIGGEFVARARGDGLIIATPTGSTAYALSAGGPIVHPGVSVLSLVPICPHTLSNRPLVVDSACDIAVHMCELRDAEAFLFTDGRNGAQLDDGDVVRVRKSAREFQLVRIHGHNHYGALRSKLGWGASAPDTPHR